MQKELKIAFFKRKKYYENSSRTAIISKQKSIIVYDKNSLLDKFQVSGFKGLKDITVFIIKNWFFYINKFSRRKHYLFDDS